MKAAPAKAFGVPAAAVVGQGESGLGSSTSPPKSIRTSGD